MSKYINADKFIIPKGTIDDIAERGVPAIHDLLDIQPSADVVDGIEIIEWREIKTRKPTDEEKHAFALDMMDIPYIFICDMPEDGEDILVQTQWGISSDICEYDCDYGYGLEERGDWDDVIAWAKMPKGIRERKESK